MMMMMIIMMMKTNKMLESSKKKSRYPVSFLDSQEEQINELRKALGYKTKEDMTRRKNKSKANTKADSKSRENSNTSSKVRNYNHYLKDPKPKIKLNGFNSHDRVMAIELMRRIFNVQSSSYDNSVMQGFLNTFLDGLKDDSIDYYFDYYGNLYVKKGVAETYPCIVSHMDTVHQIIPQKNYVVLNSDTEFFAINTLTKERTGVGGDDNCGIFCCLDNLLREPVIKLAFFVDEEVGCVGSAQADMDFFNDVSFVLQADRQGYEDVACEILGTEMFDINFLYIIEETLDKYGRELTSGGMTDVMQLAHNGLDVAMANFSCGYYNPHSKYEYVVIDELIATSLLFRDIIKVAYKDGEINFFDRPVDDYGYYGYYGSGTARTRDNSFSELLDATDSKYRRVENHECSVCGCLTTYDMDMDLNYCNNCMDYDYNVYKRHLETDYSKPSLDVVHNSFDKGIKTVDYSELNDDLFD